MTSLQQEAAARRVAMLSGESATASGAPLVAPRDTTTLLKSGTAILFVGILSIASIYLFFGGITHQGPHTNSGWLALIVAMMCIPFGLMLFTLGAAKYFGRQRG